MLSGGGTGFGLNGVDHKTAILETNTIDLINSRPPGEKLDIKKAIQSSQIPELAIPLPLVHAGHSLAPDMQFGWKP
jgi:hypothetical protein